MNKQMTWKGYFLFKTVLWIIGIALGVVFIFFLGWTKTTDAINEIDKDGTDDDDELIDEEVFFDDTLPEEWPQKYSAKTLSGVYEVPDGYEEPSTSDSFPKWSVIESDVDPEYDEATLDARKKLLF